MSVKPSEPDFSIIVPIRDEADNIIPLLNDIQLTMNPLSKLYEVLFVNDHSIDDSVACIDRAICITNRKADAYPFAIVVKKIELGENKGKTAALRAGLDNAAGKIIILMDGDRQNPPSDIPRLLGKIKNCDMVCGVRKNRKDASLRLFNSKIANQIRNWITHDNIRDAGCQLQAMTRECANVLAAFPFRLFDTDYYFFPTILKHMGYRVAQVQVAHRARTHGNTKFQPLKGRLLTGLAACIKLRQILRQMPDNEKPKNANTT
jgi:glycosyltransferase involved in cell wall biosynthesis